MILRVLGSGAGGGVPQWNCGCDNCRTARQDGARVTPRTQSSVAVGTGDGRWLLLNAGPDLRQQILSFPPLGPPGDSRRGSGIAGVILTDAEIDHSLGLLLLRETDALDIYTTPAAHEALTDWHPILPTLEAYCSVAWHAIPIDGDHAEAGLPASGLGLDIRAFALPGDPPMYCGRPPEAGDVIGLELRRPGSDAGAVYLPAMAGIDDAIYDRIASARLALIDGTFWSEDEMVAAGLSERSAADMGHLHVGGPGGSLERLRDLSGVRKIYIHINNTNPILAEDSPERRQVEEAGFEIASDGLEIRLEP